jgi:succinate dehydrogenase / fumarate reductase iron-sulfur subunit
MTDRRDPLGGGSTQEQSTIRVRIRRVPADGDGLAEYVVPVEDGMSVFNVLERIRSDIDPTLAFLISCRIGKCDICLLRVNGKTRWSCTEPPSDDMILEPVDRYTILKDLVIDWESKRAARESVSAGTGGGED